MSLIRTAALHQQLDPAILAAIVDVESRGKAEAIRHEPVYRHPWDVNAGAPFRRLTEREAGSRVPPQDFPGGLKEWLGQRISFGLTQIMGAVARERGFTGSWDQLLDPAVNLRLGAAHLRLLIDAQNGDVAAAVSAYHAGDPDSPRGKAYARRVMARAAEIRQGQQP